MEIVGFYDASGNPTEVRTATGLPAYLEKGLNSTDDEVTAVPKGSKLKQIDLSTHTPTVVCAGPALLVAIHVDVALNGYTVAITDGGVTRKTLPINTAVGDIPMNYLEFYSDITVVPTAAVTGTISVSYIEV